jgi:hypothetical protein
MRSFVNLQFEICNAADHPGVYTAGYLKIYEARKLQQFSNYKSQISNYK